MRLSPSYYPEYVDFYCAFCEADNVLVRVESIEGDDVYVHCPECAEASYVRVIE